MFGRKKRDPQEITNSSVNLIHKSLDSSKNHPEGLEEEAPITLTKITGLH